MRARSEHDERKPRAPEKASADGTVCDDLRKSCKIQRATTQILKSIINRGEICKNSNLKIPSEKQTQGGIKNR